MASKSKDTTLLADAVLHPLRPRKRPRGDPNAVAAYRWKKGTSPNPGGKPKVMQRFSAKIAEMMMQPATPEVKRALKLKRGASVFDAVCAATIAQATAGDTPAFVALRESLEGKLPQTNYTLSVQMKAFMEDKQFQAFLEEQHGEYLKLTGATNATGPSVEDVCNLAAGEVDKGLPED